MREARTPTSTVRGARAAGLGPLLPGRLTLGQTLAGPDGAWRARPFCSCRQVPRLAAIWFAPSSGAACTVDSRARGRPPPRGRISACLVAP